MSPSPATDAAPIASQRIIHIRREYNGWVANETLEDYALRYAPQTFRRWSFSRISNTALGAVSFLALEAIGATIAMNWGFINMMWSVGLVALVLFLTGLPIAYYAARYALDMDLLTRGAGFGYIGSTVTSLIYASFTFIFFAIEAAIMALALELWFDMPIMWAYLVSALIVIPFVTHGITWISRLQAWTQPVFVVLLLAPFFFVLVSDPALYATFTTFGGRHGNDFNLLAVGAGCAVAFALICQIGEQVDFLRFLPHPVPGNRVRWWAAVVAAGPGWIIPGAVKMVGGAFLAFVALQSMIPPEKAVQPTQMYLAGFQHVIDDPRAAIMLTAIFVIICQVKINVTNAYAGSLAWSNFFSRLTHSHPGRVVWLIFNVLIALMLMMLGVFEALEHVLSVYANVAVAWIGAVVADLVLQPYTAAGIDTGRPNQINQRLYALAHGRERVPTKCRHQCEQVQRVTLALQQLTIRIQARIKPRHIGRKTGVQLLLLAAGGVEKAVEIVRKGSTHIALSQPGDQQVEVRLQDHARIIRHAVGQHRAVDKEPVPRQELKPDLVALLPNRHVQTARMFPGSAVSPSFQGGIVLGPQSDKDLRVRLALKRFMRQIAGLAHHQADQISCGLPLKVTRAQQRVIVAAQNAALLPASIRNLPPKRRHRSTALSEKGRQRCAWPPSRAPSQDGRPQTESRPDPVGRHAAGRTGSSRRSPVRSSPYPAHQTPTAPNRAQRDAACEYGPASPAGVPHHRATHKQSVGSQGRKSRRSAPYSIRTRAQSDQDQPPHPSLSGPGHAPDPGAEATEERAACRPRPMDPRRSTSRPRRSAG